MTREKSIYIGTSGWSYKHWRGNFYPENISEKEYLKYYCKHFGTVEINSSFYHLLSKESVKNWIETAPIDFLFAVKASRYITHMKKLKEPEKTTVNFFKSIKPFENKIGPILFQLPPIFGFNPQRLKNFVKVLPNDYRYAFEFRNKNWFNQETYNILLSHNIGFCIYNLGNYQSPKEITSDFVYIRLHGNYGLGSGKYSYEELEKISDDIKDFKSQNKDVYCYFNNDEAGYAVENAFTLRKKLEI